MTHRQARRSLHAWYVSDVKLVCAYCREVIREDPGSRASDVSHGMCRACEEHFVRLWNGISLSEYLDDIPEPILVLDGDGRVLAANQKLADRIGRDRRELAGGLPGQAFACVRSRLPEGCGRTVHCRECTIRRTVEHVRETGRPLHSVPAWLETDAGRVPLRISVTRAHGLVQVLVEEASAPPRPRRQERV
jgi:PAS domain-containing protein